MTEHKVYFEEFDFIKAICALLIVVNHFAIDSGYVISFYEYKGISIGYTIVTVFFLSSGCLIYLNNNVVVNLKEYYFKRWRRIFPSFYVSWIVCACIVKLSDRIAFYQVRRKWWTFIFTILGFDKYLFSNRMPNYALVGEWFLGAIIIVYIVYPVISKWIDKKVWLSFFIVSVVFISFSGFDGLHIQPFRLPSSCLFSFFIGIILMKERIFDDKWLALISSILLLGILIVGSDTLGIGCNIINYLTGFMLFIILVMIGKRVMITRLKCVFSFMSRISYEIFLLQRVVIRYVLSVNENRNIVSLTVLCVISCLIIVVMAYIVHLITGEVLKICDFFISTPKKQSD